AITAFRIATTDDERKQAVARVKQDITKHIADIADKYLIPGETQDVALMFIPSESIYADLHERFDDLVQRAQRARDDRVADADGDGDPGHQASPQGRRDARGRRSDPARSQPHDEGRRLARRPRAQAADAFRPSQHRYRSDPH